MNEENSNDNVALIILNIVIIIITLYLIFLYIKSKNFKVYPCYNLLILSFVVFFDNIFRIIHISDIKEKDPGFLEYLQAILLTLLDKFLLTTATSQIFIIYMGICKTELYFSKEKLIFISATIIGIIISLILTGVYIIKNKVVQYGKYYYCGDDEKGGPYVKKICDSIFNGIFLLLNAIFSTLLIIFISKRTIQASRGSIEDLGYGHHFVKIIIMFLVNSILFIESYLIIFDEFKTSHVDLIYLISCLVMLLYYTINNLIIKETLKIFCNSYYKKKYPTIKKNETITDMGYNENDERTDSFAEE
jgi:hypothetical protein